MEFMKRLILLYFILSYTTILAQEFKIPEIKFQNETEKPNLYIELLKLKDNKSLIIKTSKTSYWIKGTTSNFIVYQNDGKIKKFILDSKNKIKRKAVKKRDYSRYWNLLNKLNSESKFELIKEQLNITSKPSENGNEITLVISDGYTLSFEICFENKYSCYSSSNPNSFIEKEFPGYTERQKLVDLIQEFDNLF